MAQCCLPSLFLDLHKQQDTFQPFARPPALLSLCPGPTQPRFVTDRLYSAPFYLLLSEIKVVFILFWDTFLLAQRMQLAGKPSAPEHTTSKGVCLSGVFCSRPEPWHPPHCHQMPALSHAHKPHLAAEGQSLNPCLSAPCAGAVGHPETVSPA